MSVCEVCGSAYKEVHERQRFCSRECYAEGVVIPTFEPTGKDFLDWAEQHRPEWVAEWRSFIDD